MMKEEEMKLLKPSKVAKLLGVDTHTIYRWIEKGYIAAIRLPSGQLRIPSSEVERIFSSYVLQKEEVVK